MNKDISISISPIQKVNSKEWNMFKQGFGGEQQVFDCTTYPIRKYRYRFVWWVRKFETNPYAIKVYNLLNKNRSN